MQASETKLRQLIEGTKQYVVPLFQRPYSWSEKQWKTLWVDVLEKARHTDGRPHFFGSIVTTPAKSVPQGVGKYLLVDGQQRLTTIQVLLAAIRDAAGPLEAILLRDRIAGQYLANTYETGDERLKILPTQDDRAAFGRSSGTRNPPGSPAKLLPVLPRHDSRSCQPTNWIACTSLRSIVSRWSALRAMNTIIPI